MSFSPLSWIVLIIIGAVILLRIFGKKRIWGIITQRIDSYWISIAGIVAGGLIMTGLATHNYAQTWIGVALVCTGMVTLTIREIFKKP
ncbi:MAG: hypothetical protein FWH27_13615 [Planctomycetaceae bacterium]|nr:hypothetical protein [Planctomycetaceae bacterium]